MNFNELTLDEMVKVIDKKMTDEYQEFVDMHEALNTYRGRILNEQETDSANELLEGIAAKYRDLHPVYYFIAARYQIVVNRAHDYDVFVDSLEKAGILKVEPKEEDKSVIIQ